MAPLPGKHSLSLLQAVDFDNLNVSSQYFGSNEA
jgi:hypothetical protein